MQSITLAVQGMTCGHCVSSVRSALTTVPGIASAQVTMGQATIQLADGASALPTALAAAEAITEAGYQADLLDSATAAASAPASAPTATGGASCCTPAPAPLHALGRQS